VSPAHLDYYLDEFTFRFNRIACWSRASVEENVRGDAGRGADGN
jgi:hypothetical protein